MYAHTSVCTHPHSYSTSASSVGKASNNTGPPAMVDPVCIDGVAVDDLCLSFTLPGVCVFVCVWVWVGVCGCRGVCESVGVSACERAFVCEGIQMRERVRVIGMWLLSTLLQLFLSTPYPQLLTSSVHAGTHTHTRYVLMHTPSLLQATQTSSSSLTERT